MQSIQPEVENDLQTTGAARSNFSRELSIRARKLRNAVVNNSVTSTVDMFGMPIKLTYKGSSTFQTALGGCCNLAATAVALLVVYQVYFLDGWKLNTSIIQSQALDPQLQRTESIFKHMDEIISFDLLDTRGRSSPFQGNILMYVYNIVNGTKNLIIYKNTTSNDPDCKLGQICIKKTPDIANLTIWGNPGISNTYNSSLRIQLVFNQTDQDYPGITFRVSYNNIMYMYYGSYIIKPVTSNTFFYDKMQKMQVFSEEFLTNNIVLGYIGNFLPYTLTSYFFDPSTTFNTGSQIVDIWDLTWCNANNMELTQGASVRILTIQSNGQKIHRQQTFEDVTKIIVMLLSVQSALMLFAMLTLLQWYTRNRMKLEIANELYYIEDTRFGKRVDFHSGWQPFIACVVYEHPLSYFVDFLLKKCCMRPFTELLPLKVGLTIRMMESAKQLLDEKQFFNKINELCLLEDEAPVRIKLEDESPTSDDPPEDALDYFPQSINRKQAFHSFCAHNGVYSTNRVNHIYGLLCDHSLKQVLVHQLQKEFSRYVGVFSGEGQDQSQEIPVGLAGVNDSENSSVALRR